MKNYTLMLIIFLLSVSCKNGDSAKLNLMNNPPPTGRDFKQDMRDFVIGISKYAKAENKNFAIVPQNGIELVTANGDSQAPPSTTYLDAIDANGQEDLLYGYDNDDQATPTATVTYLKSLLNISKNAGKKIFVTDYCSAVSKMSNSYAKNKEAGYISFAANQRDLNNIPSFPNPIYQANGNNISNINEAQNFLYLINPDKFSSKSQFIDAVKATNYDLIIMDLFFNDKAFTSAEIAQLKTKANGGKRLVISYMSIGEAEDYRYYWKTDWKKNKPLWLDSENPNWKGNYKVHYWENDWQKIIYGNSTSYLQKILDANFDGVYLDIIDGFEYYEH
ncbi:endo alpha-1,4 polygalactosaminidase [Pedobacter sp. SD-b]|uniref:Endo alpha-1,4 polygalactosaminidase n=1 Tax=Pedobacter segetis TaxID=2793069 RepID=A0ABS1BL89_9SPHI|nr:endo alpha-1,4 polygalactosaminidase [Pedobacter segetis]MBK0383659.1 endo alpha-1,4 polygalactosaminidase [Pedobacter segetis]